MLLDRMPNGTSWDPIREIHQLQDEMNQIFGNFQRDSKSRSYPQFNVWEGPDGILLTAELPGLDKEDFEVSVEGNTLTVKGTKKSPETGEKERYLIREMPYGKFSRTLKLPYRVDPDQTKADFHNGILTLELKRPEEDKPKKIKIHTE